MDFSTTLLRDYDEAKLIERWRHEVYGVRDATPDRDCVSSLVLIRSELSRMAVPVCTIASIVNKAAFATWASTPISATQMFSVEASPIALSRIERISTRPGCLPVVQAWQNMHALLKFALGLTGDGKKAEGSEAVAIVNPQILSDTWQRVCRAVLVVDECLASALQDGGDTAEAALAVPLFDLLEIAACGGWPCIDDDGLLNVPGWAERRRSPRRQVRVDATLVAGNLMLPVMIRDISDTGLGLKVRRRLEPGQTVSVFLADGREIGGTVRWSDGANAGVLLDAASQRVDLSDIT